MRRYISLIFLFLLSACVSNTDFDRIISDVNDLKRDNIESKKDIDLLKEKTSGMVKEDSFSAVKENQVEMFSRVNETSKNLQELRGRFEENRYFTEKSLKDSMTEKDLLKVQIAGLEEQVKILKSKITLMEEQKQKEVLKDPSEAPAKTVEAVKTEAPKEAEKKDTPDDKAKSYEAAHQAFKEKNFKEARERFERFIKDYPKTDLTDNAQFWIAESYYSERDYENAILSYETLLKKYPESEKTSGALLKQGYAFIELGDAKTGKIILSKLMEKFPGTKDAELAKKKIAENSKKPSRKK